LHGLWILWTGDVCKGRRVQETNEGPKGSSADAATVWHDLASLAEELTSP